MSCAGNSPRSLTDVLDRGVGSMEDLLLLVDEVIRVGEEPNVLKVNPDAYQRLRDAGLV